MELFEHSQVWLHEPINVLSSLAFLWVAQRLYRLKLSQGCSLSWIEISVAGYLILACATIGLGSMLYHAFPNSFTHAVDRRSIEAFTSIYILACLRWVIELRVRQLLIVVLALFALLDVANLVLKSDNSGASSYFTCMMALLMVSTFLRARQDPLHIKFLAAAVCGIVAMFFRAVDADVHTYFPLGTHWLWHILNAMLIFNIMQALFASLERRKPAAYEINVHKKHQYHETEYCMGY